MAALRAYHCPVFKMFKNKVRPTRVDDGDVFEEVNAALMQTRRGSVPHEIGMGRFHEPPPEYIAEATTPTEDMWAREQAAYRAKNETQDGS